MRLDPAYHIDISPPDLLADRNAIASSVTTFVAGGENRLLLSALEQLLLDTEFPPVEAAHIPVVLVGPAGSGKSMLAQALVRRWSPLLGEPAVAYFTVTDFGRELSTAISAGGLSAFRSQLRGLQLLVLEDLHQVPPKPWLHTELRRLLDELRASRTTVLCTTQINPAVQPGLEEGLRDRLLGGLVIPVNLPTLATRIELLRLAAVEAELAVDERQLRALADSAADSVPQLLRSLKEWELASRLGQPLPDHRDSLNPQQVLAVVARYLGITQATLRGPSRRKSVVFARGIAVYLLRTLTNASFAQIGQSLGNRDHSTIMHALQTIRGSLATDPHTQQTLEELRRILLAI